MNLSMQAMFRSPGLTRRSRIVKILAPPVAELFFEEFGPIQWSPKKFNPNPNKMGNRHKSS